MPTTEAVIPPHLVFADDTLYVVLGDLYALNPDDGKLLRHYPTDGISELAVANGVLYVNVNNLDKHMIQALRGYDGELLWQYTVDGYLIGTPVIGDGIVYIGVGARIDRSSCIYALRTSDGTLLWKYIIGSDEIETGGDIFNGPLLFASPIVADGVIYLSTFANSPLKSYVYALDARTGALFWRMALPVIASDRVCVGVNDSSIVALRASDGLPIWRTTITGKKLTSHASIEIEALEIEVQPEDNKSQLSDN